MTSYTVNFNGSGEVLEHHFDSDVQAVLWITRELATRGYNLEDLDSGGWDSDGVNEEDELCYRMFFWADEDASFDDDGANAICCLCVVR